MFSFSPIRSSLAAGGFSALALLLTGTAAFAQATVDFQVPFNLAGLVSPRGVAVAPDGTVNIMVYNFDPYDPTAGYGATDPTPFDSTVTVTLSGLSTGTYLESRSLVDGADEDAAIGGSVLTGPSTSLTFNLAGEGVTLVTLTPSA